MTFSVPEHVVPRRLRLGLVAPWLACGGAERVTVTLAHGFQRRGHNVSLVTFAGAAKDFFPVPAGVRRIALETEADPFASFLWNGVVSLRQIAGLRRALTYEQLDAVVAFMSATNILTTLALVGTGIPVVATEHSPAGLPPLGPIWGTLQRLTYPYVDRLVSVSAAIDRGYGWIPAARRSVIYNPVDRAVTATSRVADPGSRVIILGVGRLVPVKGFDGLLQAFAHVAERRRDCDLVIVGDGPERASLEALADRLRLQGRVRFAGAVADVASWLARADVFVSPTRTGGVGCAAMEALASGVPVIATVLPNATPEIVRDGVNGLRVRVDDVDGMGSAIGRLVDDEELRRELATRAREAGADLDVMAIVIAWERLFYGLVRDGSAVAAR